MTVLTSEVEQQFKLQCEFDSAALHAHIISNIIMIK